VIDRPPQATRLAVDLHVDLIEMPSQTAEPWHARNSLTAHLSSEQRAEAIPPQPHGLVANVDATFEQQILDVPQR
jgi:hypothetical protein